MKIKKRVIESFAAGNIYLIMLGIKKLREYNSAYLKVIWKLATVILTTFCLMYVTNNVLKSSRLIYTDLIKCKQHEMMLSDIMTRMADDGSKPIVLVGATSPKLNHACYRLEQFMRAYGIECPYPSSEQIEEANEIAMSMKAYPYNGCVKDCGEYIIVKLGE